MQKACKESGSHRTRPPPRAMLTGVLPQQLVALAPRHRAALRAFETHPRLLSTRFRVPRARGGMVVIHLAFLQLHSCCSVAGYRSTDARLWLQTWVPLNVIIWARAIWRREARSVSRTRLPCPVEDQKGKGIDGIFRSCRCWLALPPSPACSPYGIR